MDIHTYNALVIVVSEKNEEKRNRGTIRDR